MRSARTLVLTCVLFGAGIIQAHAFNMTGLWKGRWDCRAQQNGTFQIFGNPSSVLKITQTGSAVYVDLDNGSYHYSGWAGTNNKNADRGATTVVECRTDPTSPVYNEIISADVNAPSRTGSGKFIGISVYNSTDALSTDIGGTCSYIFQRTSSADPGVGPCSP
jgi:hypothetical protein